MFLSMIAPIVQANLCKVCSPYAQNVINFWVCQSFHGQTVALIFIFTVHIFLIFILCIHLLWCECLLKCVSLQVCVQCRGTTSKDISPDGSLLLQHISFEHAGPHSLWLQAQSQALSRDCTVCPPLLHFTAFGIKIQPLLYLVIVES